MMEIESDFRGPVRCRGLMQLINVFFQKDKFLIGDFGNDKLDSQCIKDHSEFKNRLDFRRTQHASVVTHDRDECLAGSVSSIVGYKSAKPRLYRKEAFPCHFGNSGVNYGTAHLHHHGQFPFGGKFGSDFQLA